MGKEQVPFLRWLCCFAFPFGCLRGDLFCNPCGRATSFPRGILCYILARFAASFSLFVCCRSSGPPLAKAVGLELKWSEHFARLCGLPLHLSTFQRTRRLV